MTDIALLEFPLVKTRKKTSASVSNHFFNIKQSCELELDYAINPPRERKDDGLFVIKHRQTSCWKSVEKETLEMLVRSLGLKISCKSDCYCYYVSVRYAERKTGKEERKKRKAKKSAPPEPLFSSCNIIFWSFVICYWKIKRQYGPKNYRIFVCFKEVRRIQMLSKISGW